MSPPQHHHISTDIRTRVRNICSSTLPNFYTFYQISSKQALLEWVTSIGLPTLRHRAPFTVLPRNTMPLQPLPQARVTQHGIIANSKCREDLWVPRHPRRLRAPQSTITTHQPRWSTERQVRRVALLPRPLDLMAPPPPLSPASSPPKPHGNGPAW